LNDVFVTTTFAARERELMRALDAAGVRITPITADVARSLSDAVTPQGIVAVVATPQRATLSDVIGRQPRLVAVLDDVQDPGNAGTIIRTADAVGADAIVLTPTSVDPANAKCVRASAGSIFHLPIVVAPTTDAIEALTQAGVAVMATDPRGDVDLDELEIRGGLRGPVAWVFGNEARGLPEEVLMAAKHRVRISISGRAESFNLAAAATICLYASSRATRMSQQS
jgi:TrmH family RNA methyltransferase